VAFDALRQGVKELEFLADPGVGELRIGCPEWITAGLLPMIIDDLVKAHPRLKFHVQNTIPATSEFRELRQRTIDVVLGRIAHPFEESDLQAEVLYQEHLSIVAGINSPWARRRKVDLADLVDERWILLPQNERPGSLVADAFRARGLKPPQPTVSAFSIHMRDRLLATGRYVSVVPDSVLQFAGDRLSFKALPVKLPILPRPVAIVTLRHRTLSPVAQLFIECARKLTKSLARASR
jgi:DNA-binding transcriptional LysR family regulator